jgi:hypothetical protein
MEFTLIQKEMQDIMAIRKLEIIIRKRELTLIQKEIQDIMTMRQVGM